MPPLAARGLLTLVGPGLLDRIWLRINRVELKIAASGKVTVTNGATKSAISLSRTTPAISGRKILVGLLALLRARSHGRIGIRSEVGADIAANQRPIATVKTSITRTTKSTMATSQSPRRKNMPSRPRRSPPPRRRRAGARRLAASGSFCDHAGWPGFRHRAIAVHAACHQQAGSHFRHT